MDESAGSDRLQGRKLLITAGVTWVAVDRVRVLTSIFGGRTGAEIALYAARMGAAVTLLLGPGRVDRVPLEAAGVSIQPFRYYDDLAAMVESQLTANFFDAIIHSAAVSDYCPRRVYDGKIPSRKRTLSIPLKPLAKIINRIREIAPRAFLVKFKLEVGKSEEELLSIGYRSLKESSADLLVANDLDSMQEKHTAFIIDPSNNVRRAEGRGEIARLLLEEIAGRLPARPATSGSQCEVSNPPPERLPAHAERGACSPYLSPKVNGLRHVVFTGNHYTIGYRLGERLQHRPDAGFSHETLIFARRCQDIVRDIYPPIMDKIEGMVDGGKLNRSWFECEFFAKRAQIIACAGFAVASHRTQDGYPLVGRNYHWGYGSSKWCAVWETHPRGGNSSLGYTHHWCGCPDVMNDKGLFLGLFSLFSALDEPITAGFQWHTVVDMVMETCGTVHEAGRLIASLPHLRPFGYLLADKQGGMLVAEHTGKCVKIREPEDGFIAMANHCVTGGQNEANPTSVRIYKRLVNLLQAQRTPIKVDDAVAILADHPLICCGAHAASCDAADDASGTLFALLCRPAQLELAIAPGHPCQTPFHTIPLRPMTGLVAANGSRK